MLSKIFGQGKTKQGLAWLLYDFANSVAIVVFFLYFSQWLVVENGIADIWYNLIFVGSSLLLVFSSPILGIIADKTQKRMPYLIVSTVMFFVCLVIVSFIALFTEFTTKNSKFYPVSLFGVFSTSGVPWKIDNFSDD